ncbi:progonadoliberin-2 [Rissa tridactyla]|uniref:progonadoliberin-2 n=1 Tax=Rissa tridactyla TaxID=75485 RepID=UPI0023BAF307|nr:progonadoliberin-2 [Rissa tridactyla]
MAPRVSLLLLALLLLAAAVPRCPGQHWSHGWYPGGKRDLAPPPALQVPSRLWRCSPPPCPPRQPPAPRREEPLLGAALRRR